MTIAVTPEHVEFAEAVTKWAAERDVRAMTRALLDTDTADVGVLWRQMADYGWAGLLVPEEHGGSAATWSDAVVFVEALAQACAPLPVVATLAVTHVLAAAQAADTRTLLAGIADGTVRFGTALAGNSQPVVLGGAFATHVAVIDGADVDIYDAVTVLARRPIDASSGLAHVELPANPQAHLPGAAEELRTALRLFLAADSVGVAAGCLNIALEYVQVREAFGRLIGTFQAVKHHCANMLLGSQTAAAAVWRAAAAQGGVDEKALVDVAGFLAATSGLGSAKSTLQVLGGIGFTWEHDLHLYLRRAGANQSLIGPLEQITTAAGQSAIARTRPTTTIRLPPEAETARTEATAFRDKVLAAPPAQQHAMIVDAGYLYPGWPKPWGRGSGPLDQLVIEEVFHNVDRQSALGATHWEVPIVLPTILDLGTPEQIERWIRPSMLGEIHWCQLFSEPSAGSDLASLATRAVKTEGGWLVTGQKVWTSDAHHAEMGMALVRTDPDAKKHKGISCLMIDMHAPGVEVRPLRQITGDAHFNEVFLDSVFVPDENMLGSVNDGWNVTLRALEHERTSLGGGANPWTTGAAWEKVLDATAAVSRTRPTVLEVLGELVLISDGALALHHRSAYRALLGRPLGIEGTIGKTVVADLAQRVGDFSLDILGHETFIDGDSAELAAQFLHARMATIAGGTSEILRNLLAEQALGLPREPISHLECPSCT